MFLKSIAKLRSELLIVIAKLIWSKRESNLLLCTVRRLIVISDYLNDHYWFCSCLIVGSTPF